MRRNSVGVLALALVASLASGAVAPVSDLTCTIGGGVAYLDWTNGGTYDGVRVLIDGAASPGSPLAGSTTSYRSDNAWYKIPVADPRTTAWFKVAPGTHTFTVTPYVGAENAPGATCSADAPSPVAGLACAVNADLSVTLTWTAGTYDAIEILRNGAAMAALEGTAGTFTDADPSWSVGYDVKEYEVVAFNAANSYATAACSAGHLSDGYVAFQEGVVNGESTDPADLVSVVMDANTGMFVGYGQDLRNWNNGGGFYMEEGDLAGVGHADLKDIFLKVDTTILPAGTIVVGAELAAWYVYMRDVSPVTTAPQPHTLYARATRKEWNEGIVLSGAFGWGYQNGAPANAGEVTFNSARHASLLWEIPGAYGDTDVAPPDAQATTVFNPTTYRSWVRFNVTNLVQACVDGSTLLALKITQNGTAGPPNPAFDYVPGLYGFATSEYGEPAKRPRLVVRTLQAVTNVAAQAAACGFGVTLTWTNVGASYDSIAIVRNGVTIAQGLPAQSESYEDTVPAAGSYTYEVVAVAGGKETRAAASPVDVVTATVAPPQSLACTTAPDGSVMLTWNADASWAIVEVYGHAAPATPIATLPGAAAEYTDADPGWNDGFESRSYGVRAAELCGAEYVWSATVYCAALNLGNNCYAFQDGVVNGRTFDAAADVVADAHILVYGGGASNTGRNSEFEEGSLWAGFAANMPWGYAGDQKDMLLKFDVAAIPAGSVVVEAELSTLYFLLRDIAFPADTRPIPLGPGPYAPPEHDLFLRETLRAWNEGLGVDTATNYMNGRAALPGEVTWNSARHGEEAWEIPGAYGDTDVGPIAATTRFAPQTFPNPYCATVPCVTRDPVGAWVDFDVVDLVQAWVDDPAHNLGFKLTQNGSADPLFEYVAGIYNFASSEFPETAKRPKLVVKLLTPPADVVCTSITGTWSATLAWTNDPVTPYENVKVFRDGALIDTLAGAAVSYVDASPAAGPHTYAVRGVYHGHDSAAALCAVEFTFVPPVAITACAIGAGRSAHLAWTNGSTAYSGITLSADGVESTLDGAASELDSAPLAPGTHIFTVTPFIVVGAATYVAAPKTCAVLASVPAPTALACTSTSPTAWTVDLQWQNGWAYDSVVIERNGAVITTLSSNPTSFTDTVIEPGTYAYAVSGTFGGQISEQVACAAEVSFVPPVTLTSCVFNVDLTVSLAWENKATYDAIVVLVDGTPTSLPGIDTSFQTPALEPGTHELEVIARIGSFNSAPVACNGDVALPAPAALTCSGVPGSWNVHLAWESRYAYENVMILRGGVPIETLAGAPTTYTDTVPGPGTYEYQVYGFFGSLTQGSLPCSTQIALPSVAITQCTIDTNRIAHLTWDLGTTSYTSITVTIDGTAVAPSLGGGALSFTSAALDPGTHQFEVIPSIGAFAATAATCSAQAPLPALGDLVCTASPGSWNVQFTWTNAWTYTSIQVLRNGAEVILLPGGLTSFTDTVGAPGTYQYAFYSSGGGQRSPEVSCTADVSFVPPVTITTSTVDAERRAHIAWTTGGTVYDGITILVDGTALSPALAGSAVSFDSEPLAPGEHTLAVRPFIGSFEAAAVERSVSIALPPPSGLACSPATGVWSVDLAWTNGWSYDRVTIVRDGVAVATLDGAPAAYTDTVAGPGPYEYRVSGERGVQAAQSEACVAEVTYVPAVAIASCTVDADGKAHVVWTAEVVYGQVAVLVDGVTVATLAGDAATYDSEVLTTGSHTIAVVPSIGAYASAAASCTVEVMDIRVRFIRADANTDGAIDIADAIRVLGYLFTHATLSCLDAGDSNDDGYIDIADAIYSLSYSFASGPAPKSPFPSCGLDPTADALGCDSYPAACPAP